MTCASICGLFDSEDELKLSSHKLKPIYFLLHFPLLFLRPSHDMLLFFMTRPRVMPSFVISVPLKVRYYRLRCVFFSTLYTRCYLRAHAYRTLAGGCNLVMLRGAFFLHQCDFVHARLREDSLAFVFRIGRFSRSFERARSSPPLVKNI
jgi:hypothetical protein